MGSNYVQQQQIMIESENQGFDKEDQLNQEIAVSNYSFLGQNSSRMKPRLVFRKPLCVNAQIPLYIYQNYIDRLPMERILNLQKYRQIPHPYLYSDELISTKKLSLMFPSRLNNYFNKFHENLNQKSQMTMNLKNINLATKNEGLKGFQLQLPDTEVKIQYGRNLSFESRFQQGNLHSVFVSGKQSQTCFIFLQNDINTHGYNQWFLFRVKPILKQDRLQKRIDWKYRFIIVNLSKQIKFNENASIMTCSQKNGWQYKTPFLYYPNKFIKDDGKNLYSIDFKFQFDPIQHQNGVYFSLTYPYTFSKLISYLKTIKLQKSIKITEIGKSQGKNSIYQIFIKKIKIPVLNNLKLKKIQTNNKNNKCIVIIARQHPCQTSSSFVCEHIINHLLNSTQFKNILTEWDWFIFPMINPDGVIHGHSRTNLKGYDINRCWSKESLMYTKQADIVNTRITQIMERRNIQCIIDLHGHSKQNGCFGYFSQKDEFSQLFNFFMTENCPLYSAQNAKFGLTFNRRPTFRGQMYYRNQIKNSITIQTSLFGYEKDHIFHPFVENDFIQIAQSILGALDRIVFIERDRKYKILKTLREIEQKRKSKREVLIDVESDSDPQGQYLAEEERNQINDPIMANSFYSENFPTKNHKEEKQQKPTTENKTKRLAEMLDKRKGGIIHKRRPIYTSTKISFHRQIKQNTSQFLISQKTKEQQQEKQRSSKKKMKQRSLIKDIPRYTTYQQKSTSIYPTSSYIKISMENLKTQEYSDLKRKCNTSSRKRNTKSFGSHRELEKAVNDKNWTRKYVSIKKISSAYSLHH